MMLLIFIHLLRHHRHEATETDSELRRVGKFILAFTFSTLSALVEVRGSNSGGTSAPHQLLDFSFVAVIFSLAFSALHLQLPRQLPRQHRRHLARLFLSLAVFFTITAVVLSITSFISPGLCWVLFAVFCSILLILVCFKQLPETSLHYIAALLRCRFVVFLTGPPADDAREATETDSMLRRVREFILVFTFSTLSALVQVRQSNSGGTSAPHQLLNFSFVAVIFSLAFSALHLQLPRQLPRQHRRHLARLFLRLAVFFTATAVVLLITSFISPGLCWVPFAVFCSKLLILVCFKQLPETSLHYIAALLRCRFVVFLTGPPADGVPEATETDSELRRVGEFILGFTFSTLSALVEVRGSNSGGTSAPHQLLDFSFVAVIFSLAFSALHLELPLQLPSQLRLHLARLFLRLAAFFTTAAVVLLITSFISPGLRWVPFAVFCSILLILVCFKQLLETSLHYIAALLRCRFVVFLTGAAADDVHVQSPSNQLSPTSMDEHVIRIQERWEE